MTICKKKENGKHCLKCNETFRDYEDMACTGPNQYWHMSCFVCSQCFRSFGEKHEYYNVYSRLYCERDFKILFAPNCSRCKNFIIGRFIRALNKTWHANCFLCHNCNLPLADLGFLKSSLDKSLALCHTCHALEKQTLKRIPKCVQCNKYIGDHDEINEKPLYIKGEPYHSYHFNCYTCGIELNPDGRIVNGDVHCLKCHDRMHIPICGGCRRPIEERVVTALGRQWHIEHFVCCICEKPFHGKRHFDVNGKAYCEDHFFQSFGHRCQNCAKIIRDGLAVNALNKFYCQDHFCCYYCGTQLKVNKTKFFDVLTNPCCKKCYRKMPVSVRKQSKSVADLNRK